MLIDFLPDPGPPRGGGRPSAEQLAKSGESFGAVLATLSLASDARAQAEVTEATGANEEASEAVIEDDSPLAEATIDPQVEENNQKALADGALEHGDAPDSAGAPVAVDARVDVRPDSLPLLEAGLARSADERSGPTPAKGAEGATAARPAELPSPIQGRAEADAAMRVRSGAEDIAEAAPRLALQGERVPVDVSFNTPMERAAPAPVSTDQLKARLAEMRLTESGISDLTMRGSFQGSSAVLGLSEPGGSFTLVDPMLERMARAAPGTELARDVAQQIAGRITPLGRGQFEMMLSPAELGRVEIALREVDGVLTLKVAAERPETLELIRRHVEILSQELRQATQRELALELGSGETGSGSRDRARGASVALIADAEADTPRILAERSVIAVDHLDLRL